MWHMAPGRARASRLRPAASGVDEAQAQRAFAHQGAAMQRQTALTNPGSGPVPGRGRGDRRRSVSSWAKIGGALAEVEACSSAPPPCAPMLPSCTAPVVWEPECAVAPFIVLRIMAQRRPNERLREPCQEDTLIGCGMRRCCATASPAARCRLPASSPRRDRCCGRRPARCGWLDVVGGRKCQRARSTCGRRIVRRRGLASTGERPAKGTLGLASEAARRAGIWLCAHLRADYTPSVSGSAREAPGACSTSLVVKVHLPAA